MRQTYMIIDGKRYEQGAVFVVKWHDGIAFTERRTLFYEYDTETNRYTFITPTYANADHCTSYPDIRFMDNLIRIATPTEKEIRILNSVIQRKAQQRGNAQVKPDNRSVLLMMLGLIILMAALPPVGVVVFFGIVFSDGTPAGFVGCLTPFLILVGIALITMLFT